MKKNTSMHAPRTWICTKNF